MGKVINFRKGKYEVIARKMVDKYEEEGKKSAAVYLLTQGLSSDEMVDIKPFVADEYIRRGYTIREENIE